MKITRPIKNSLLLKELEVLGTITIDAEGERCTNVNLTFVGDGYELTGVDVELAQAIVEAHDEKKDSEEDIKERAKKDARIKMLNKLKITEEELKGLFE